MCWDYYQFYRSKSTSSADEEEELLRRLHEKHAPLALQHVLSLGGYYVKCAQMFCGMNLLPVAYEKEFSCLLDSVPAKHSFATIQSIIENELGGKLQDHFAEFDETPIAAASIGQVHCAKVRDKSSGDEVLKSVVVKVQYPEVEKYFKMDVLGMKNLCYLCTLCDIEIGIDQQSLDKIFNEFTSSFQEEFDYRLEAQNMKLIADNMEAVPEFANSVKVPHPFLDTTSRKVLTMEKIQGEPIKKRMNRILQEWAERSGKTMEELQQELQDKFQDPVELQKMMEQKPPSKAQLFLYRVMLWTWDLGANTGVWLENQLRSSTQQQKAYKWSTLPVDASRICRLLFQVHAHQLFINGAFNADPHAGNILICEDTNNTNNGAPILGLIDFGNVQRIPNQDRRKALAKFYLSMATDFSNDKSSWNDDEIARRFAAVGGESVHMDTAFLACNALTMYDMRFDAATLARLSLRH
ncbi:OF BC1 COMPLEX KINASE 8, chloroplastic [Seminavis robusta]|uniref:OF BC1 COMPLEX KINASE 8, chloroplastic n=1 Tax=Seminavis robusta TaxID=568900 RepID=A0A9N8HK21_9STRA|nr:OF BC1 COMPLEX KINASE 8, chloroplastic [Seminavis robusta]|eukprot:Sro725_g193240.1 OF BC1 COMPLEX KINASE 8, chloroplastic (466) ;mRNA; f:1727-3124